jgi:predicted outer membrane repeat protein
MKKYEKIIIPIIFLILFSLSLSTINAVDVTLNPGDAGGVNSAVSTVASGSDVNNTITLNPGTYNKTTDRNSNITFSGKNLTIQGNGSTDSVIIDAQNLGTMFNITGNSNITFINITFLNGNAENGGAVYKTGSGTLTITNSAFTNNTANTTGGAIYNTGSSMNISNSIFNNNIATFENGGAIFSSVLSTMAVNNSTFINNTANGAGGAIFYGAASGMIVINSTFTNNSVTNDFGPTTFIGGGAIYNSGDNALIANSTFTNNSAFVFGGAIENNGGDNISIINSNFTNNTADNFGGAIINIGSEMNITNSTFTHNTAENGGAVYNGGSFAITNIDNSTFNNNIATDKGGALNNEVGIMNVVNSTFLNNIAAYGGGIFNLETMMVSGNTMEGNLATILGQEIFNNGTMGVLNLTYLNNSTITVNNNTNVVLNATLTDDMGNLVTGQSISFFVNGTFIGIATAIEGVANLTYFVSQGTGIVPVTGDYAGHAGFDIVLRNGQLLIVSNTTVTSEITLDKDEYRINETVKGTVTITNTGNNTATNVTTRVIFPSNFVLDSDSVVVSQGTFDPTTGIWSIGDLAPGEQAIMTFTGRFTSAGESTISIETTGDNFETSTDSATAIVEETPIPPEPPTPTPTPTNETSENQAAVSAAMKKTGIPIPILALLGLLSLIGVIRTKKH